MRRARATALGLLLALGACDWSNQRETANESAAITPVDAAPAISGEGAGVAAGGLVLADLDAIALGGRVSGPVGTEINASLATALASLGDIESWVACPAGMASCEPANAPPGTLYTYVHRVTPGTDAPNDAPFAQPEAVEPVETVESFAVRLPLAGFTGKAGWAHADAARALGPRGGFEVVCREGALIFTPLPAGSRWRRGAAIRLFWQSTVPPAGPAEGYELAADGKTARGTGPSPVDAAAPGPEQASAGPAEGVICE